MRLTSWMLLFISAATFVSCGRDLHFEFPGALSSPPTISVDAKPPFGSISINEGAEVLFKNDDTKSHSVTSDQGKFDTGIIPPGVTNSLTFYDAGIFNFHCKLHAGESGTIQVSPVTVSLGAPPGTPVASPTPAPGATPTPPPVPAPAPAPPPGGAAPVPAPPTGTGF